MVKRVTIKDVAAKAAVSYQTVSKVLTGRLHVLPETENRIGMAAKELGYRPNSTARNLRTRRSRMLGYSWVPSQPNQANHVLDTFLTSMVMEAELASYHLLPSPYRERDTQMEVLRELIDTGKVDGFVISSVDYDDPRLTLLMERQFPFVAFGRSYPELDFPYVDVDGEAGVRTVTEHLLARGHRRIALLGRRGQSPVGSARVAGYRAAMQAAGVTIEPEWVVRGEGVFEFAYAATQTWLTGEPQRRPTAIVALEDSMAIGAMHAVRDAGLQVGEAVAVVGFDDTPAARYALPPLTSVRQPIREAGRKCVEMLLTLLDGRQPALRHVLLKPELVVRVSG
jgi:DNA-binding LacI/PurR family transcriptional regulator